MVLDGVLGSSAQLYKANHKHAAFWYDRVGPNKKGKVGSDQLEGVCRKIVSSPPRMPITMDLVKSKGEKQAKVMRAKP